MELKLIDGAQECRLIIAGRVTQEFSGQLEAGIINAMRRYPRMTVDLSGVDEIDRCGLRLLELMQRLGGKEVRIESASTAVEDVSKDAGIGWRGDRQFH